MASLPARQPSQARRASPPAQQRAPPSPSHAQSPGRSRSDGSQPIFVHKPEQEEQQEEQQQTQATTSPPPNQEDDPSIKKCWICFSDSTEDTPDTSPWRDPCPCALVAHEECLLDWIADMEAPKNNRNRPISTPKIECPQCKAEIKLARPKDYLVDAVRGLERLEAKAVTPGSVAVLCAGIYNISLYHGVHSVYAVFGAEDGFRILRPLVYNTIRAPVVAHASSPRGASEQLLGALIDAIVHWRLYIGLPLITPILVLSRTTFADKILPVLPIVFFASQAHSPDDALDFAQWPPSASFAFAVLPYVRSLYNAYYKSVWAEKEKRWLKEIQPRITNETEEAGAAGANGAQNHAADHQADQAENVFEVRIDGAGLWDDWEEEEEERLVQQAADNNPPAPPAQVVEDEAAPPPADIQDNQPQAQNQQPPAPAAAQQPGVVQQERRLSFSPTAIAETVLGALIFPTIAGLTGEALKLVLPTIWTMPPPVITRWNSKTWPRGFLQQKWARSLIGGCLFVVGKDVLMLYVRWKMAQMHRSRRIVDVDRRRLRNNGASTSG